MVLLVVHFPQFHLIDFVLFELVQLIEEVDVVEEVDDVEEVEDVEDVEELPASWSAGFVPTDSVPVAKVDAPPVALAKATIP